MTFLILWSIIFSELIILILIACLPDKKPENFFNYMPKRKPIDTSLAAFRSLDVDQVQELKSKIIEALNVLGKASSEELAIYLKKAKDSVWKRCSDLKNEGKIYASDFKVKTKRGREARQWMLTEQSLQKTTTRTTNPSPTTVSNKQTEFSFT